MRHPVRELLGVGGDRPSLNPPASVAALLNAARLLNAQNQPAAARSLLETFLASDAGCPAESLVDVFLELATCRLLLAEPADSVLANLKQVDVMTRQFGRPDLRARLELLRGKLHEVTENLSSAADSYARAAQFAADHPELALDARLQNVVVLIKQGRYDRALAGLGSASDGSFAWGCAAATVSLYRHDWSATLLALREAEERADGLQTTSRLLRCWCLCQLRCFADSDKLRMPLRPHSEVDLWLQARIQLPDQPPGAMPEERLSVVMGHPLRAAWGLLSPVRGHLHTASLRSGIGPPPAALLAALHSEASGPPLDGSPLAQLPPSLPVRRREPVTAVIPAADSLRAPSQPSPLKRADRGSGRIAPAAPSPPEAPPAPFPPPRARPSEKPAASREAAAPVPPTPTPADKTPPAAPPGAKRHDRVIEMAILAAMLMVAVLVACSSSRWQTASAAGLPAATSATTTSATVTSSSAP